MKHALLTTIIFTLTSIFSHAKLIRSTSYCPQEPGGFYSCTGQRLRHGDCAADLRYYPLGTRLQLGAQTYTVADCGSAVVGPNHIDIFCTSLKEMRERGTLYTDVGITKSQQVRGEGRDIHRHSTRNPLPTSSRSACIYNSKYRPRHWNSNDNTLLATL